MHVIVLSGLAVAVFLFIGHRLTLKHDYVAIMNGLFGASGGPNARKGLLGDFRHIFVISPTHLYWIGFVLVGYASLEAVEMVGPVAGQAMGRIPDVRRHPRLRAARALRVGLLVRLVEAGDAPRQPGGRGLSGASESGSSVCAAATQPMWRGVTRMRVGAALESRAPGQQAVRHIATSRPVSGRSPHARIGTRCRHGAARLQGRDIMAWNPAMGTEPS